MSTDVEYLNLESKLTDLSLFLCKDACGYFCPFLFLTLYWFYGISSIVGHLMPTNLSYQWPCCGGANHLFSTLPDGLTPRHK